MAKPNYGFEKRQRELAKKQKREAKRLKKTTPEAVVPVVNENTTSPPELPPSHAGKGS